LAQVDYLFAPQSPWTYLGHQRFVRIAAETGASVRVLPMDLGRVFPVSGGLPLAKRPPQRQAYRLVELARFSQFLQLPLNLQPRYFPVAVDDASRLIIATGLEAGTDATLALCGRIFAAVWAQERNIADPQVLAELVAEAGLSAGLLERARAPDVQQQYDSNTQLAIDTQIFGAPSYVVDGEIFWGQDRLDFLERKLRG
jgi:2-hydroxychromene-2-carboxylate isomerase